ncbi:MAG: ATP synthase F1 subunit delta [Deltaproteobacteria bacterium]|nr:ATP synthase F1 subunit delta [Deltaproteobacteria bacterium]
MTTRSPASRRYAEALLETATSTGVDLESLRQSLADFAGNVATSFELRNALLNPSFTEAERRGVLDALMTRAGAPETLRRFLQLLLEKGRIAEVEGIAEVFKELANARAGRLQAHVTAAVTLDAATQEELRRALEKRTGRSVEITVDVDPSLIAGLRTQLGSIVYDGSVRAHLERLKAAIVTRA